MTSKVINEIIVFKRGDSNVSRMFRFDNHFRIKFIHLNIGLNLHLRDSNGPLERRYIADGSRLRFLSVAQLLCFAAAAKAVMRTITKIRNTPLVSYLTVNQGDEKKVLNNFCLRREMFLD